MRPVDVTVSEWDCTLEPDAAGKPALRLGFRLVRGLSETGAQRLVAARATAAFSNPQDLAVRAQLNQRDLEALAAANALAALTGNRHQAAWSLAGVDLESPLFVGSPIQEATPMLRTPTEGQNISADYMSVGLTLRRHPIALLRERFQRRQIRSAQQLSTLETQRHVRVAGLVLVRQSPGTAHNTTFMTLEDETGVVNVIVWSSIADKYRRAFLQAQLLEVGGQLQHEKGVMHVIAEDLVAYIDSHYRTIPDRNSRGLSGHSMGGYGTIRIGMKRPDLFSSIYALSPCCMGPRNDRPTEGPSPAEQIKTMDEFNAAPFGVKASLASSAAWAPNPKNPE